MQRSKPPSSDWCLNYGVIWSLAMSFFGNVQILIQTVQCIGIIVTTQLGSNISKNPFVMRFN